MTPSRIVETTTTTRTVYLIEEAAEPVQARYVAPAPKPIAAPNTGRPAVGDLVEYTSQQGRTANYRVSWVGTVRRGDLDVLRVGLKGYNRRNPFFVDASDCRYVGRAR